MAACPECNGAVAGDARVCRHCFHVIDREAWQHDAGRLGGDRRELGPLAEQAAAAAAVPVSDPNTGC